MDFLRLQLNPFKLVQSSISSCCDDDDDDDDLFNTEFHNKKSRLE
jgi:hypothetical protein